MEPGLPGVQLPDGLGMLVDCLRLAEGGSHGLLIQQLLFPDGIPRGKHALFPGRILTQHLQSVLQSRQLGLSLGHPSRVPVEQRIAVLPLGDLRLTDFHTAHMKQTRQQRVPVLGKGDEPDPFHFDNGH